MIILGGYFKKFIIMLSKILKNRFYIFNINVCLFWKKKVLDFFINTPY